MDILTTDSLANMISSCAELNRYKGLIVLWTAKEVCEFIEAMNKEFGVDKPLPILSTEYSKDTGIIRFKNNSYIKVVTEKYVRNKLNRGRYNDILLSHENSLSTEEVNFILRHEFEYRDCDICENELFQSEELDDFLKEFKIIKEI